MNEGREKERKLSAPSSGRHIKCIPTLTFKKILKVRKIKKMLNMMLNNSQVDLFSKDSTFR